MKKFLLIILYMLLSTTLARAAGDIKFAKWFANIDDPSNPYAITFNDSGNGFGQFCNVNKSSCYWVFSLQNACKNGIEIPVLINSDNGGYPTTVICDGKLNEFNQYRYIFTDFKVIENIINTGGKIGMSFPIEGGQFTVVRFYLDGAKEAVKKINEEANKKLNNSTVNQIL